MNVPKRLLAAVRPKLKQGLCQLLSALSCCSCCNCKIQWSRRLSRFFASFDLFLAAAKSSLRTLGALKITKILATPRELSVALPLLAVLPACPASGYNP
jgi:hypothetical protein